jgi:ABC-type xylose transport system substrate-binding protein
LPRQIDSRFDVEVQEDRGGRRSRFRYSSGWRLQGSASVQTVSVWQDYRQLGRAAAEAAVQLCRNRDISKITGTTRVTTPGGNRLTSILLTSVPITKDNLSVILATGRIKKDELC